MANLLLLDDSEVAGRAMRGIAARSRHRCAVATTVEDAWKMLRELVVIDLVVVEVRLREGDGAELIGRLRADSLLRQVPVLVYTGVNDHALASRVLLLKIQNYLIKPYSDDAIHQEIARACTVPWRALHFEEERSFCAQLGLKPADLLAMREALRSSLEQAIPLFEQCAEGRDAAGALERLGALQDDAQGAGYWGLSERIEELRAATQAGNWARWTGCREELEFVSRLLFCQCRPDHVPEALVSETERREKEEAAEKDFWREVNVQVLSPALAPERVMKEVDALAGCPAMETTVAEFQMAAEAKTPDFRLLMDLVVRDPALCAQVLVSANALEREHPGPVEDPRTAATLLGNVRLNSLTKSLPQVEERHLNLPPMSWSQFWMFQMGVANLALYTAKELEFEGIQGNAYTAGLLHDIRKLMLLKLHPYGFRTMVEYARTNVVPLHEAERKHIGCTTREIATRFCQSHPLPPVFAHVIQWVETPQEAAEDQDLVAVVSLARNSCLQNHVGYCGDTPRDECLPVEETPAWDWLRNRVYPSFNIRRFDQRVQEQCRRVKQELLGRG